MRGAWRCCARAWRRPSDEGMGVNTMYIVAGLIERHRRKHYNAAVLVRPGGGVETYRKIHLFHEEKLWFEISPERLDQPFLLR